MTLIHFVSHTELSRIFYETTFSELDFLEKNVGITRVDRS